MMIKIVKTELPNRDYCFYDEEGLFFLEIKTKQDNELVGIVSVHKHPEDKSGGQVGIEITKEWRNRWLRKGIAKEILHKTIKVAKEYNLTILYSVALADISPRMLEFFGFIEYYLREPKTYYYMKLAR